MLPGLLCLCAQDVHQALQTVAEGSQELRWAVSLLPLVQRNLSAEWSDEVFASDASLWGRGVVSSHRDRSLIREQSKHLDRWRFNHDEEQSVLHAPPVGLGTFSDLLDFEKSQAKAGDPRRSANGRHGVMEVSSGPVLPRPIEC